MRRSLILLLLVGSFLAVGGAVSSAVDLPPGGSFQDDNGNVHEPNIEAVKAADITRGCNPPTNDRYCPDDAVTRGEMAAFIVRTLGLPAATDDYFEDDDGTLFEDDINRLAEADVTKGCNPPDNDRFCPDGRITRGQLAAFLVRGFGYVDDGGGDLFVDDDTSEFEADIDRLGTAGVTKGCNPPTNDRFCPGDLVLRDQMASFLARAKGLDPIIPPPPPPPPPDPVVLAIGDSVMLGAACEPPGTPNPYCGPEPNLETRIPKLDSDAVTSRNFSVGDNVLAAWLNGGYDPDVVIVHLGTNGGASSSSFDDIMNVAGPGRQVLFVTVKQKNTSNETAVNNVLKRVDLYANATLVDWKGAVDSQLGPGYLDGIDTNYGAHLWSLAARQLYVDLIEDALASL